MDDQPAGAERSKLARLPVLIVEDEPLFARVLRSATEEDFEPTIVATVAEATSLIPTRAWGGALVDVRLPDGNGCALLPLIRARCPQIPIIIMTGGDNAAESQAAFPHDASFLTKPFAPGWYAVFRARMLGAQADDALDRALARIGLSGAERAVFTRLAAGATAEHVATALSLSVYTVRTHCTRVHRRLGVNSLAGVLGLAAGWLRARA